MGSYRIPPQDTPRSDERSLTLDDAGLPLVVAGLSAPIVIAAIAAGVTWGVGESIAAAALSLALASLGARLLRWTRGGRPPVCSATASSSTTASDTADQLTR